MNSKIDVHNHVVPPVLAKATEAAGGDPSGWFLPTWSPASAQETMRKFGIAKAYLSVTSPGPEIVSPSAQPQLSRELNEYVAKVRNDTPEHFGFFASVPGLMNTEAALREIAYALDVLKADGITLFTRYGDGDDYLGHVAFKPIWEELNARKAIVFIHPTHPVNTKLVHSALPQPVLEYPHETAKTAFDLIMSGTKRAFPDCKIILSHGGGTFVSLLSRAATLVPHLPSSFEVQITAEQIMEDAKSFYFDLALSSSPEMIELLLKMVPTDRILYGSDTPYAPDPAVGSFRDSLDQYPFHGDIRKKIESENAKALFSSM